MTARMILGEHAAALEVRLTEGDGATLAGTLVDPSGDPLDWPDLPTLEFSARRDPDAEVVASHVATVDEATATWTLSTADVAAIAEGTAGRYSAPETAVRITLPDDADGRVEWAGLVNWRDGWTPGERNQRVTFTLPGPPGRGVVSITDPDATGTATITYTDGTTALLPLPGGGGGGSDEALRAELRATTTGNLSVMGVEATLSALPDAEAGEAPLGAIYDVIGATRAATFPLSGGVEGQILTRRDDAPGADYDAPYQWDDPPVALPSGGTTDGQTKALIESPTSETAQALSATIGSASRAYAEATAPVPLRVFRNGQSILVRSPWSPARDLLMPFAVDGPNANGMKRTIFVNATHGLVQSVDKTAPDSTVWPTVTAGANAESVHVPNDDNAPILAESSFYTGGNHGWSGGSWRVGQAGHGKTDADRGSQWTDGTNTFTLARVIDANLLLFFGAYQDLSGGRSRPVAAGPTGGTLTHVSGATNTGSIVYTSSVTSDMPEPAHSRITDVRLDGRPLLDGTTDGHTLTITETYTVVGFKGIVNWSRANIGADPFAESALAAASEQLGRFSSQYRITASQMVVQQTITFLMPVAASVGVTQATALQVPAGGTLRQFMPGVGTVAGFNLSTYADVTTVGANVNIALADQLVPADPASRMYQWAHDSGGARKWGLAMGLLPYLSGARATRRANGTDVRSWFFSALKKNYPQLAWQKVYTAGEQATGIAFRRYLPPDAPAEMVVDDGARTWLLIDTPTAHATAEPASVPRALSRSLVVDGTATVTPADTTFEDTETTYTNTAPGYLIGEAVLDATI